MGKDKDKEFYGWLKEELAVLRLAISLIGVLGSHGDAALVRAEAEIRGEVKDEVQSN